MSLKRIFDILLSSICLLLFMPVIAVVCIIILLSMGRPVFFIQERPGLRGRPFKLVKFRTMRAPGKHEQDASFDSARITAIGRFLRATSIDELPTLWNVLKGDMSFVGPRPLLMQYLSRYSPAQARRHEVKPGITGWAQVNGRNAITWEQKFEYDVWYVDNRSFMLDIRILLLTVIKVLKREGIGHGEDATMPEFMGSGTDSKDDGEEGEKP